ncbi:DUF6503 family protein [Flavobacteriaceae bacterium S356]|uniref:DUF6503 family protein n=1 Tax=Asprobacillus argus TaxID=3076534 RepID=A0ABU3LFN6_9FLAO|nr:DUF6503 family protein [Flavobacteriaceae bacterium S356]
MKKLTTLLFAFFLTSISLSQNITGPELLEKAIQFHDPKGVWETFSGKLHVSMETPNNPNRDSNIKIDLPNEFFYVKAKSGKNTTEYTVDKEKCLITFNGDATPADSIKKKYRLSCKRAELYKNYYTYLYGLPMKLKDPGTIIDTKVTKKKFKGKEYLVLKATYKKEVGKDIWYFYFDPKTYAMEVYQFYHNESKNDGEYILLSEMETINDIKMPKKRAWYMNKDAKYLGTDILKAAD